MFHLEGSLTLDLVDVADHLDSEIYQFVQDKAGWKFPTMNIEIIDPSGNMFSAYTTAKHA